jgi:hypothetical protein
VGVNADVDELARRETQVYAPDGQSHVVVSKSMNEGTSVQCARADRPAGTTGGLTSCFFALLPCVPEAGLPRPGKRLGVMVYEPRVHADTPPRSRCCGCHLWSRF